MYVFQFEDGWAFFNGFGQCFKVTGMNDRWAAEDASAYVHAGRPFGRVGMRRLENTFGVKVTFAGRRDELDAIMSDEMENHGY